MKLLLALGLFTLGLSACAADGPRAPAGQNAATSRPDSVRSSDFVVAGVSDEMDSTAVRRLKGAPDSVNIVNHPYDVVAKLARWRYRSSSVAFGPDGKVLGILLHTAGDSTRRGLRVGDSEKRVYALYGPPSNQVDSERIYFDGEETLHVLQVSIRNGRVSQIYVGWILD